MAYISSKMCKEWNDQLTMKKLRTYRQGVDFRRQFSHLEFAGGDFLLHSPVLALTSVQLILDAIDFCLVLFLHLRLEQGSLLVVVPTKVLEGLLKSVVVLGGQGLICREKEV